MRSSLNGFAEFTEQYLPPYSMLGFTEMAISYHEGNETALQIAETGQEDEDVLLGAHQMIRSDIPGVQAIGLSLLFGRSSSV